MSIVLVAAICGLLYFGGTSKIGYHLTTAVGSPIFIGFVLGMIYGQVAQGLLIGATIQLVYLGVIATGGNVPADQALAATIAIPIALQTGMSAEVAVGLAVPFGVLGVFVDQIRRTSNSVWGRWADKFAEKGDRKGIFRCAIIYPAIFGFCLRFIPVFAINLVGAEAVSWLMGVLPQWIITGFSVAGGLLPALGFAIIIITIGRKDLLAYFFFGFFAVAYLGINTMAAAVFGGCIAVLVTINARKNKKGAAA